MNPDPDPQQAATGRRNSLLIGRNHEQDHSHWGGWLSCLWSAGQRRRRRGEDREKVERIIDVQHAHNSKLELSGSLGSEVDLWMDTERVWTPAVSLFQQCSRYRYTSSPGLRRCLSVLGCVIL